MKPQFLVVTLSASLGYTAAQSLPGLPSCAQDCANGAIPSECSPVDVECICATRSFIVDMACCVQKSCGTDDQKTAIDFANGICGGAGVIDLPQSATCAGDATATTTTTSTIATTAATVTTTETTISNDGTTTTTTEHTGTVTTTTSTASGASTSTLTASGTSTSTETSANPAETDGAVLLRGKNVGILAGIVAGFAFML
ncbi:hypothetical protein BDW74DRAFT_94367 [Aspergillus multicolor]|uniref:CFEM domain-containing protein n=1 Tax=Aspergillus multicolor TaxID=41759 RepID=UPI003CCCFAC7